MHTGCQRSLSAWSMQPLVSRGRRESRRVFARSYPGTVELAVRVRNRSDSFTAEGALLSQWTASRSVASTPEVCAVEGEELSV